MQYCAAQSHQCALLAALCHREVPAYVPFELALELQAMVLAGLGGNWQVVECQGRKQSCAHYNSGQGVRHTCMHVEILAMLLCPSKTHSHASTPTSAFSYV
jgi:hypothetical protein